MDHPTGCAVGKCTDGLLSGNLNELMGDIDWHEANYQSHWTYLHDALLDVADHTFLPSQSPSHRKHVVIIIADGGLTDYDGDACSGTSCGRCPSGCDSQWKPTYPGMLDDAQQKLRDEDVVVFGIVMRRFSYHTFQDDNAEAKLKPLVTDPKDDHFMNLMLDEIPGQVLEPFCDPNSKFGKTLIPPVDAKHYQCSTWGFKDECNADSLCEWKTPRLASCPAATGCPELNCQGIPQQYKGLYDCSKCKLQRATVICGASVQSSIDGTCEETHCAKCCDKKCCDADAACGWKTPGETCERKVCEYTDQNACENDPDLLCKWDGSKCDPKPCGSIFVQEKCLNSTNNCQWDTSLDRR